MKFDLDLVATILRSGISLILLMSLIMIVQVFLRHRRAYKLAPRVNGLLPSYTATMAGGVFILETALGWAITEALRFEQASVITPNTIVRLCLYSIGSFLILAGLMILKRTETRRIVAAEEARKILMRLDDEDAANQG